MTDNPNYREQNAEDAGAESAVKGGIMQQPSGQTLIDSWAARRDDRHGSSVVCPGCGENCLQAALQSLAYTFELCQCDQPEWNHLVEQLWHVACLRESSHPTAEDLAEGLWQIAQLRSREGGARLMDARQIAQAALYHRTHNAQPDSTADPGDTGRRSEDG